MNGAGEGNGFDLIGLIMASNEAALQWAQLFTGQRLPGDEALTVDGPGDTRVGVSNMGGLLLLGGLVIVAIVILKD